MELEDLYQTLARYNRWMNERLFELCARLSDAERKEDVGAFFRSIHGTLNHGLLADRVWMGRFTDRPFPVDSLDQELYADFAELRDERERTDAEIQDWVAGLDATRIDGSLRFVSVVKAEPHEFVLGDMLAHFFNHQTHHRGQLSTLLHQRGHDPGVTDLMWLPGVERRP